MPTPDLALCRRFVDLRPPPGELLLCGLTGSHLYGFPSADSDLDLKGIHQAPTEKVLGLSLGATNHDVLEVFEGVECDLTTHELHQAVVLLSQGNGNMLERIHSPIQLVEGPVLDELRALSRGARCKASGRHYHGYFRGMKREHLAQELPEAKSLLYSYRVALTGIHLLETGEVESHLPTLAQAYGFQAILELVSVKLEGSEGSRAPTGLGAHLREGWATLEDRLLAAMAGCALPEKAPNLAELEAWLVERRRGGWGG